MTRLGSRSARAGIAVLLIAVFASACGDDDSPESSSASTQSPAPTTSSTPTAPETSSSPEPSTSPALEDGRHPAHITAADADASTITIDVVQWFTGDAASEAAEEDGAPEVPPPNDYWIRNENPLLRTLAVAADASITTNTLTAEESGSSTENVSIDLEKLASFPDIEHALFWITVDDGVVTKIHEQFLP